MIRSRARRSFSIVNCWRSENFLKRLRSCLGMSKELAHFQTSARLSRIQSHQQPALWAIGWDLQPAQPAVWTEAELLISTTDAANLLLKPCRAELGSLDRA